MFLYDMCKLFGKCSFEATRNVYSLPIPSSVPIIDILYDWPSHTGKFKGAIDIAVTLGTPVIAPLDGQIIEVVDMFNTYGPTKEYAKYLNYITIAHLNSEYSQLAHIAKGSATVQRGQSVVTGQMLGVTGLNGWMEEPFLEHVHMFVFRLLSNGDFKGLKIQLSGKLR